MNVIETVTTAAGEQVDVVDADMDAMWSTIRPLVTALWDEGAFVDPSGLATRLWWEAACRRGYTSRPPAINHMFQAGLGFFVKRQITGKRCFEVKLVRISKVWLAAGLDDPRYRPAPMTVEPRSRGPKKRFRQVDCPLCGTRLGYNNLLRHLTQVHQQPRPVAKATAAQLSAAAMKAAEAASTALAVVSREHADNGHVDQFDPRATAVDLMMAMVAGVRRDDVVPIRALPSLQDWLAQTERTLAEVVGD